MKTNIPSIILLVLGTLGVAKCVLGLAKPALFKRLAAWWSGAMTKVNTLTGILCMVVGFSFLVVILLNQPLRLWVLGILGVLYFAVGLLYLRRETLQRMLDVMVVNRTTAALRGMFAVGGLLSLVLIWIALSGWVGA